MSGDSAGLNDIMLFRSGCRHGWSSIYMCVGKVGVVSGTVQG